MLKFAIFQAICMSGPDVDFYHSILGQVVRFDRFHVPTFEALPFLWEDSANEYSRLNHGLGFLYVVFVIRTHQKCGNQ